MYKANHSATLQVTTLPNARHIITHGETLSMIESLCINMQDYISGKSEKCYFHCFFADYSHFVEIRLGHSNRPVTYSTATDIL